MGGVGAHCGAEALAWPQWKQPLPGCGSCPSLSTLIPQVGITLHYSSLSTLLWMGVKARVLHKELTWRAPPPQEGDSAPPAPRPMLRYMPPDISFAGGGKGSEGGVGHQINSPRGDAGWVQGPGRPLSQRQKRQALGGAPLLKVMP